MGETVVCGNLVDARGFLGEGCLLIRNGFIAEIREDAAAAANTIDVRGRGDVFVMPGFIDLHVHLRGLMLSYKEDEYSGTAAAVAAGVTLVGDMPNTVPRLDTVEALAAKLRSLEEKSLVDYAVYAGVPSDADEAARLLEAGAIGFKIYPGDLEKRGRVVEKLLRGKGLVVVHPELPEAEKPVADSEDARRAARNCSWETAAVKYIAALEPSAKIHVTHVSCPSTLLAAKRAGFSTDTTPTYLFLEPEEGCLYRVNPPIRGFVERQLMLQLLLDGVVDAVASDHAPHSEKEKLGDPLTCPPGIAWLEQWPLILYCLVGAAGALSLPEFLRLVSAGPAEVLGLGHVYGLLEPGYRGNVVVAEASWSEASSYNRYSKARLTPYAWRARRCMRILYAFAAGEKVYDDEKGVTGRRGKVANAAAFRRAPVAP
jgi:dihydroorotase